MCLNFPGGRGTHPTHASRQRPPPPIWVNAAGMNDMDLFAQIVSQPFTVDVEVYTLTELDTHSHSLPCVPICSTSAPCPSTRPQPLDAPHRLLYLSLASHPCPTSAPHQLILSPAIPIPPSELESCISPLHLFASPLRHLNFRRNSAPVLPSAVILLHP